MPGMITTEEGKRLFRQLTTVLRTLAEVQQLEKDGATPTTDDAKPTSAPVQQLLIKPKAVKFRDVAMGRMPWLDDDKKRDPNSTYRPRVTVFVHVDIIKMGDIDTKAQKFNCELRILSRWFEPELDGHTSEWMNKKPVTDWNYWHPDSYIVNHGNNYNKEQITYSVMVDSKGTAMVEENRYLRGSFFSGLELHDYPFDKQDLTITMSTNLSPKEVCYRPDPALLSQLAVHTFSHRQEWALADKVRIEPHMMGEDDKKKSAISISCVVKRHSVFFVFNVLTFMIAISALAFSTFSIDFTKIEARLPLTFLLMLSNTTFKFAVSRAIPRIPYLTYLDKYVLTSLVVMVILCFWHTSIGAIYKMTQNRKDCNRIDYGAMAILCVVYICFNTTFIVKTKYTVRKAMKRKLKQLKRDEEVARLAINP